MVDATLSDALKEAYASAPSDEVVYHTLEINHPAFSIPIRVVRDYDDLDAVLEVTAGMDWVFTGGLLGFTGVNATVTSAPPSIVVVVTAADPQILSPTFDDVDGWTYQYVQARVKRTAGTAAWQGRMYYSNSQHGFDASHYKDVAHPNPGDMSQWATVEWDMHALTVGGTDWKDYGVHQLRLDLVETSSSDVWFVDWVRIVRYTLSAVTFTAFAFDVKPPEVVSESMPTCLIEIDNVGREVLAQVEAAANSAELVSVIYRQYLSGDLLSGPENDPPLSLTALAISADVFRIRMTCGFGDLINKKFPADVYTVEQFPGLVATS